jgi:hypothetical protein
MEALSGEEIQNMINSATDGDSLIIIVFVLVLVCLLSAGGSYFGKFFCPEFGYKCSSTSTSTSTRRVTGSYIPLDNLQNSTSNAGDQQGAVNRDCEGEWVTTYTGQNSTYGVCSEECYDVTIQPNVVGYSYYSFNVTNPALGTGQSCLDVATNSNPNSGHTVTNVGTTVQPDIVVQAPGICNRNVPCFQNCSLGQYAPVAGAPFDCNTGLQEVEAAFTVSPDGTNSAACSYIVGYGHTNTRNSCPNVAASGPLCNTNYTYHTTGYTVNRGSYDETNPPYVTTAPICVYYESTMTYGEHPNGESQTDTQNPNPVTCPAGYTLQTTDGSNTATCIPIGDWYTCASSPQTFKGNAGRASNVNSYLTAQGDILKGCIHKLGTGLRPTSGSDTSLVWGSAQCLTGAVDSAGLCT